MTTELRLLTWEPATDTWMADHGFMDWQCYCGCEVRVDWRSSCVLYNAPQDGSDHEPITAEDANTSSWQVECLAGHVLLICHELAEDETSDNFAPPTTEQIVTRLASPADVEAWRSYVQPKPPWNKERAS